MNLFAGSLDLTTKHLGPRAWLHRSLRRVATVKSISHVRYTCAFAETKRPTGIASILAIAVEKLLEIRPVGVKQPVVAASAPPIIRANRLHEPVGCTAIDATNAWARRPGLLEPIR